jgi:hypothetical protein
VPFVRGEFRKTVLDPVAFLGFLGSAFVSKVRGWYDEGGACDDDVSRLLTTGDCPLKELVSDRQSSSSESDILPPAGGRVGHWEEEW